MIRDLTHEQALTLIGNMAGKNAVLGDDEKVAEGDDFYSLAAYLGRQSVSTHLAEREDELDPPRDDDEDDTEERNYRETLLMRGMA